MVDAGDGFAAVALAASEVCPHGMYIFGFLNMTLFTSPPVVKFDALVGICQTRAYTHPGSGGAVWKETPPNTGYLNQGTLAARLGFIFLIIAGADFILLVAADGRGDFLLGR